MSTFEELEWLNAQIDIWIDEEEYEKVVDSLPLTEPLKSLVESCLCHPNCTRGKDPKWSEILYGGPPVPIASARHEDLLGGEIGLDAYPDLSRLFYAKLLRARIQQKGTDCYLWHLDEVVAYLENHLPAVSDGDPARLAVFYLLELSAASQSFEILGFAERVRRIIRERAGMFGKDGEDFCWYYDLWARYNLGVGYFHGSRYRRAIMEFNYIIRRVQEAEKSGKKTQLAFFKERQGYLLLYLPAVLYRADVQLKLQLAYHALDTMRRDFRPPKEISDYKRLRGNLVKANANQQMKQLDRSWPHLAAASKLISGSRFQNLSEELGEMRGYGKLPVWFDRGYQKAGKQFLELLIQDHLEWLEAGGGAKDVVVCCINRLECAFHNTYFQSVEHNSFGRRGYFQQLADFLRWLTRKYKHEEGKFLESPNGKHEPEFIKVAQELYRRNSSGLMESEEDRENAACPCGRKGLDLDRMDREHYSWITGDLLDFYDGFAEGYGTSKGRAIRQVQADKKGFVKRLIKLEREQLKDLRINDLTLRYKSERVRLTGGLELCRGGHRPERRRMKSAFSQLLYRPGEESDPKRLNSEDYRRTMKRWDAEFLDHLQSESNHKEHKHGLYLIGLQRWNSSSPAQGRSVGGGYLLYHTNGKGSVDLGVAIDPGFDFVRNLFHMGFSISDIDIVLISHSHVDHVRDFESIVQLLADLKDKGKDKRKKCVHVILSLGVYERLKHIIEDPFYRYHVEPYIIDAHREIDLDYFEKLSCSDAFRFVELDEDEKRHPGLMRYRAELPSEEGALCSKKDDCRIKIKIQPTRAYHPDPSNYSDSFGFLTTIAGLSESSEKGTEASGNDSVTVGYTGDTKWVHPCVEDPLKDECTERTIADVSPQYFGCDAVIVHLGSLVDTDKEGLRRQFMNCLHCDKRQRDDCRDLVCRKDHPYLVGLLRMLSTLHSKARDGDRKQLVLVSEFGEELRGGIRTDLIERLRQAYGPALSFLPVDVGMDVQLWPETKSKPDEQTFSTKQRVWCVQCGRFVDINDAEFERYGVDEALFCVCRTCRKATPLNVMQDKLRQLYEVGRELRTLDDG